MTYQQEIGRFPTQKPAHSWSEIEAIEKSLPKLWKRHHKKLIKAAKNKGLPKDNKGQYKDTEKLVFGGMIKKGTLPNVEEGGILDL